MTIPQFPLPESKVLALAYSRISEDPLDQRRGVKRQREDLRAHCDAEDWHLYAEFSDNDLSALSGDERPDYDRLMATAIELGPHAAKAGKKVVVLAYHSSRLWRNRVERAQAIEDLRRVGAFVAFEAGGFYDLTKASQRSALAQAGENDTTESEVKGERVERAALERAQEGRANGNVLYGWRREYDYDKRGRIIGFNDVEDLEQAAIVREIVRRILAGESLIAITLDLNERNVSAPGAGQERKLRAHNQDEEGSRWGRTSVKKIALRKANIGIRVHRGAEYPAAWPALVTSEEHARVETLLADRASAGVSPGQRKHMLSWTEVATCGECGSWLRVAKRGNRKRGRIAETYVCQAAKSCVGRNKEALDKHVENVVVAFLSNPGAADIFKPDETAAMAALELVAGLKARQAVAADDYADGLITREQLLRINQSLGQQISEAQAEVRRLTPAFDPTVFDGLVGSGARERWDALEVGQKTQVLEALQFRVTVLKVSRRGPGFDPASVEVERLRSDVW
ncbi:recombinase family protein [Kitasatospora sp. GP82]|uniref:recombinase family protein n=1 Tax=Kitasatospora sp. GP82 TaxID=3035089 RepID=UPI002477034B|nr:recombinase family protein [Kitasatospora sp. GP82]